MVGETEELVAARGRGTRHLLDRRLAVRRPGRVAVHLAAEVAELDELRQVAAPGRLELAAVLAQLRRDVAVAEERVQRLLVAEGMNLSGLDHRDAVLGDREAVALRLLAQGDVVVLRAREVLQQVAVALRRHDPEIEPEPLLADHGRLGVAVRDHLEHPRQADEVRRQRGRVRCGRDHVEVAERLPAPPRAARLGDVDRGRVRAQRLDDLAHDREPLAEEAALRLVRPLAVGEGLQHLRLRRRAHSRKGSQLLTLRGGLQLGQGRDAELAPDARRRLRAEARQAHERGYLAGNLVAALRERLHVPRLDDLDDLGLDRLADIGQLLRPALESELGDRRSRIADPRGSTPVGGDAERLLAEDLREVGEELQPVREIAVSGQGRDHAPIIGRGRWARLASARIATIHRATSDCLPPHLQRAREPRADGAGPR